MASPVNSEESCPAAEDDSSVLPKALNYLLMLLQRKDRHNFFGAPVTDAVAPGYSQIIKNPIDFSTIQENINGGKYKSLVDFKMDVKLMCANALNYNQEGSLCYKAATSLLASCLSLCSQAHSKTLKATVSFWHKLTPAELGFSNEAQNTRPIHQSHCADNLSAKEIVAGASKAREQKGLDPETLPQHATVSKKPDGAVLMRVLNPVSGIVSQERKERFVNLGEVCPVPGKKHAYCPPSKKTDLPLEYLEYGPFCSFAPQIDSSFATLSERESRFLLQTAPQTSLQYASSLLSFFSHTSPSFMQLAVKLVKQMEPDIQATVPVISKRLEVTENLKANASSTSAVKPPIQEDNVDLKSLSSLAKEGIDVSFLDKLPASILQPSKKTPSAPLEKRLAECGDSLRDLERVQLIRLGCKRPHEITDTEANQASVARQRLGEVLKGWVPPSGVTDTNALRYAAGFRPDKELRAKQRQLLNFDK